MPREKALVTPSVLRWARETHGLDIDTVATKLKRDPSEIASWESGEEAPTLPQARAVAKLYRRPLAVFFLPEPPLDVGPPTLPDFRRMPQGLTADFPPELRLLVRTSQLRQEWVRDDLRREGRRPLRWVGIAKGEKDPSKLAPRVRHWLNGTLSKVESLKSTGEALRFWIDQVEDRGAFVFQSGGPTSMRVDPIVARGFALLDRYAPFIMLNGSDSAAGRIFTLLHEVIHIWIDEPGVSNLESLDRPRTPAQRVEEFCNRTAAEVLLPMEVFRTAWGTSSSDDVRLSVEALSRRFKVSREVVARRAADTGFIRKSAYLALRSEFNTEWKEHRSKRGERDGGPDWYVMVPKRAGYAMTRRAISAFADGRITGTHLAELLNSKIKRLGDIAANAGMPWAGLGEAQ